MLSATATAIKLLKTKIVSLSLVVFISSILVIIGIGLTAYAQQQTQVFIVGADNAIHEANLKATKDGQGQLQKISTFKIEAPNVVQINQGKDLVVFTNPPQDQVQKVKIRNTQGQLTELERVTRVPNTYSLAAFPVGVYVLDVIVQLSNNRQGAYETILVIVPANQQPQPINFPVLLQIIQTVIDTDIRVIIDDDNGDDGPPPEEICDNGRDDDSDGLVDSEDPDCPPDGCPAGQELQDEECLPICPEGQHWDETQGKCIPDDPCIENPDLPECDPCIENPELPECVEPCPDGRASNPDGTCPPTPTDPCEENPDLPECQPPPGSCPPGTTGTPPDCESIPEPPGPCPEGEHCPPLPPPLPGPGLLPEPPEENEEEEESGGNGDAGVGGGEANGDDGGSGNGGNNNGGGEGGGEAEEE